jgi:ATPase AAA-2 domain protein
LTITDDAINEAVDLSVRYITDRFLPDKAIDLIDEACSLKSMKYNFDETEIKLLKEKISENNKKIEDYVISQQYKKAFKLKEKQIELENKITNLKQKFQVPKNKRFNVTAPDVQKVLSISSGIPVSNL